MLRYADVISELGRLVVEAKRLRSHSRMHLDPAFRRWRHELETCLSQAESARFELPGAVRVHVRSFGASDRIVDNDELFAMYQREMDDTVIELETIISTYQRVGEPEKRDASDLKPREWPAKITLAWLFHNAPLSLWTWLASALVAVFFVGAQVGQSDLYKQFREAIAGVPSAKK